MLWPLIDPPDSVKRGYCCPACGLQVETGSLLVAPLIIEIIILTMTTMAIYAIFRIWHIFRHNSARLKVFIMPLFSNSVGDQSKSTLVCSIPQLRFRLWLPQIEAGCHSQSRQIAGIGAHIVSSKVHSRKRESCCWTMLQRRSLIMWKAMQTANASQDLWKIWLTLWL